MENLQNEIIGFIIVAVVVLLLALLGKKYEDKFK
jgi:hypothetical protein